MLGLFVAVVMLPVAAPTASAQTEPVRIRTTAGFDGYVDPTTPLEIVVEIEADVLFVGSLEASVRGTTALLDVEVPAGSRKTYTVVLPSPTRDSTPRIRLLTDDGTEVAREWVNTQIPVDRILVGLVRDEGLRPLLTSLRDPVGNQPITPVALPEMPNRPPVPLGYLVVPAGVDLSPPVLDWIDEGGRLVTVDDVAAGLGGLETFGSLPGAPGVRWFGFGRGEVLTVDSLASLDAEAWTAILRPVPIPLGAPDAFQTPEQSLIGAATAAGDRRVPTLPWLAAALVGYAVVVGPVNFWLLRRACRRDAAWVTIPLISLVAVVGFWIAGRQRLEGASFTHASIQIFGEHPDARTAVVVTTGSPSESRIQTPETWTAYPTNVFGEFGFVSAAGRISASGSIVFDLPQLGAAGLQARRPVDPDLAPRISASGENVSVTNTTDVEFWAWGVVDGSRVRVGPRPLPSGEKATLALDAPGPFDLDFGTDIANAVINDLQLWDEPAIFERLYALTNAALWMDMAPTYFFGFTSDDTVDLIVDDDPIRVVGDTLVVVPLDLSGADGVAWGEVISAPSVGFFDRGPGFFMIEAPEIVLEYRTPTDLAVDPELKLARNDFAPPAFVEAWDWQAEEFVEVEFGEPLDRFRFVAASGSVIVKTGSGDGGFDVAPFSPDSIRLVWESP